MTHVSTCSDSLHCSMVLPNSKVNCTYRMHFWRTTRFLFSKTFPFEEKINVKNMFLKQSSTFINEVCIIIANSIKNCVGLGGGGCLTNTIVIATYMYQNLTASISMFEQDIEPGRHWGCILINLYVYLG